MAQMCSMQHGTGSVQHAQAQQTYSLVKPGIDCSRSNAPAAAACLLMLRAHKSCAQVYQDSMESSTYLRANNPREVQHRLFQLKQANKYPQLNLPTCVKLHVRAYCLKHKHTNAYAVVCILCTSTLPLFAGMARHTSPLQMQCWQQQQVVASLY